MNGVEGKAPVMLDATVGTPVTLDASKSRDRDGNPLRYVWLFYPEAGTGLPNVGGGRRGGGPAVPPADSGAPAPGAGPATGVPPAPPGGRPVPPPRVTVANGATPVATVTPNAPGVAHVILAVTDSGTPSLTSYRRIILTIQTAGGK